MSLNHAHCWCLLRLHVCQGCLAAGVLLQLLPRSIPVHVLVLRCLRVSLPRLCRVSTRSRQSRSQYSESSGGGSAIPRRISLQTLTTGFRLSRLGCALGKADEMEAALRSIVEATS